MGWASGSTIFLGIIESAKKAIPDFATRKQFYTELIDLFEDADWDTQNECMGQDDAYDEALIA